MNKKAQGVKKCLTCDRYQYCPYSRNQGYNGCRQFLQKIDRYGDLFGDDGEEYHQERENATAGK